MSDRAEIGSRVNFKFDSGEYLIGDVLYVPITTGDCWIIREFLGSREGLIYYVQQFNFMAVYPESEGKSDE